MSAVRTELTPMSDDRTVMAMAVVNVRELARKTSQVISSVQSTKRPALVTRGGRPVAAVIPIDPDVLEDWILANAPEFTEAMAEGDRDLREGRTVSFDDYLAARRRRPRRQQRRPR